MRALGLLAAAALLSGCLADDPVAPAATNLTGENESPVAGICVIGVDSPCNAPEWRSPGAEGPRPLPPSAPIIRISPLPVDPLVEVELSAELPNSVPQVTFVWDFGDGATAEGALVRHSWNEAGQYRINLTALTPGGTRINTVMTLGVRLQETLSGKVAAGADLACIQAGVDCGEHPVEVPPGLVNLTARVAPDGALPPSCTLTLFDPDGAQAGQGQQVAIAAPASGTWMAGVTCRGVNVDYLVSITGTFRDDFP